jgi:outer membrane lipoprotein-sorting protein
MIKVKMTVFVFLFILLAAAFGYGQTPSAAELLRRVDDNEIYATLEYEGDMIIDYRNRRTVKTLKAFVRGNSDSFIEFTNPEDRGFRYLKTGGQLHTFTPDLERPMRITRLKESLMGSDLSYEDTMENDKLSARFDPVIGGAGLWNGRDCWILELSARDRRKESYPRQKLWIDKETGDCLHTEMYALNGKNVCKESTVLRIETIGGRRFPVEVEMRDPERRAGSKTTFIMRNLVMDRPIADSVFSQQNLTR